LTVMRDANETTKQPAVLNYNIYSGYDVGISEEVVVKSYASIVANSRGIRLSASAIEPFEHEAQDIYYIIDWISKQPRCNGNLWCQLFSFSQWAATKKLYPALKTIIPKVSGATGIDFPHQNGIIANFTLR